MSLVFLARKLCPPQKQADSTDVGAEDGEDATSRWFVPKWSLRAVPWINFSRSHLARRPTIDTPQWVCTSGELFLQHRAGTHFNGEFQQYPRNTCSGRG